jgi:hypothetical protein
VFVHKHIIVTILTALILVGCSTNVPIPRPGQLLYVTTFDSFNEDWQLYEGELAARIVTEGSNPVLQIAVDSVQDGAFTTMKRVFSDFDVIVDLTQVAGPEDQDAPGFGLLFRHKNNDNFYAFLISGDGYYQVRRRLDGVDEELSDWAPTSAILQGSEAINHIRVIGQGDTFAFFINDVQMPLCLTIWNPLVPGECQVPAADPAAAPVWSTDGVVMQLVDGSIKQGRIGLGARSFAQAGVRVDFDNLLVCGPLASPAIPYRCEETAS